ncbi:RNA polymerase sigma factor [Nannocystaceae bacterium ST9]
MTTPSTEQTDADLLARWRAGDAVGGERLFTRHFARVERFFLNKVGPEHVGDLVQETFIACVEGRDRIKEDTRFRAYLMGVAHNVLCGFLRRKYAGPDVDVLEHSIAALSHSPSSILVKQEEQRMLLEALRALSVRYQVVLELYYWEGMQTDDIAEALQVPSSTARTWLRRARHELEAELGKLSRSREKLEATLTRLDDWAASCGREIFGTS